MNSGLVGGICAVLVLFWALLLVAGSARSMSMEDAQMLNEWRKEIVRLQYTDFCSAVKPLSPQAMQIIQQVIKQGEEAKHPIAIELKQWFEGVAEKYAERGCGDA